MWNDNEFLNPNNFLNYQRVAENSIFGFSHASNLVNPPFHVENGQEASEQMAADEIDSWLLSNPDSDQINGCLNVGSYGSYNGNDQCRGQFIQMQTQNFQTSHLLRTNAGIVPVATIGTMDLPGEWALNPFSFSSLYPGNLLKEQVGSYSNSTNISSIGTQQPASSTNISSVGTQQRVSYDGLQKPYESPLMSRQDRLLRYFEKKKTRKYGTKVVCSSRKKYAQTRPRIRGRFASSQTDASDKTVVCSRWSTTIRKPELRHRIYD